MKRPRTHIYIDGFNLYYGAIRRTQYHWLNLLELCQQMLPEHDIQRIWYFTAMVSGRDDDPAKPLRQQVYLRALRTFPEIRIELGQFTEHKKILPLVDEIKSLRPRPLFARVLRTDEKGSDVNLAVRLVHEAHQGLFDAAVVVSNDSDLVAPIRLVRQDLKKTVGLVNPHQFPSKDLVANADFVKQIRRGLLERCSLPKTLSDAKGTITCPEKWRVIPAAEEI